MAGSPDEGEIFWRLQGIKVVSEYSFMIIHFDLPFLQTAENAVFSRSASKWIITNESSPATFFTESQKNTPAL